MRKYYREYWKGTNTQWFPSNTIIYGEHYYHFIDVKYYNFSHFSLLTTPPPPHPLCIYLYLQVNRISIIQLHRLRYKTINFKSIEYDASVCARDKPKDRVPYIECSISAAQWYLMIQVTRLFLPILLLHHFSISSNFSLSHRTLRARKIHFGEGVFDL